MGIDEIFSYGHVLLTMYLNNNSTEKNNIILITNTLN